MTSRRIFMTSVAALSAAAFARSAMAAAPAGTFEITKSEDEWKRILSPEAFYILRQHGTERAFSHPLDKVYDPGAYSCAGCDLPLFSSETKYDSKSGWPSFWAPLDGALGMKSDRAWGMVRTEVHCKRCGGHQGHVFPDGPKPTGQRFCINGAALKFVSKAKAPS